MERLTITQAVNEIAQALAILEVAKEECKDVVEATLDAYFVEPDNPGGKLKRKNLVKLAKAMRKGAKEEAKEEADDMAALIESLERR